MSLLSPKQIDHFNEQGYVVIEKVIDPTTVLDPVIDEYTQVLDFLANELYQSGQIVSEYSHLPFDQRFITICHETGQTHQQFFDFSLPKSGVKADTPFWAGPAVFHALTDSALLDAVESLIGSEIYSNPVQHVRIKPPEHLLPTNQFGNPILGATTWHQDQGVITPDANETEMITVWFSLEDVSIEQGPLKVVPKSHKPGLQIHCLNYTGNGPKQTVGGAQIPEKLFAAETVVPLPVKRGEVILMHKHTIHGSLPNLSDTIRWSFDLRYNPTGQATGRQVFPGFVARSRQNPGAELRDPDQWSQLWSQARTEMAQINQQGQTDFKFDRWYPDQLGCA